MKKAPKRSTIAASLLAEPEFVRPKVKEAEIAEGGAVAGTRGTAVWRAKVSRKLQRAAEDVITEAKKQLDAYALRVFQLRERLVAVKVDFPSELDFVGDVSRDIYKATIGAAARLTPQEQRCVLQANACEKGAVAQVLQHRHRAALGVPANAVLMVCDETGCVMTMHIPDALDDGDAADAFAIMRNVFDKYGVGWILGCEVCTARVTRAACVRAWWGAM
jgi:hypothetical protein